MDIIDLRLIHVNAVNDIELIKEHSNTSKGNSLFARWDSTIRNNIHSPITKALLFLTDLSTSNPKRTYYGCILFSIAAVVTGLHTNFYLSSEERIWFPEDSRPASHLQYIEQEFSELPRMSYLCLHSNGESVLTKQNVELVFDVVDTIRNNSAYREICVDEQICQVSSVLRFWNNSHGIFQRDVLSDDDAIIAMSAHRYGDGAPAEHDNVLGTYRFDSNGKLSSAQAFFVAISLPYSDEAQAFELDAIDVLLDLRKSWGDNPEIELRLEMNLWASYDDEFLRSMEKDVPLTPMVFVFMSCFTCAIFWQKNKIHSRALLGLNAVISVLISMMTGFGIMFTIGVTFTSMTQILPFVVFGIGLDDAFILAGSYNRTDPNKSVESRIRDVINDIGVSVVTTTTTSVLAFGLGCMSSVPAIYWLCAYASFTIAWVLFFQVTFFVSAIVLDERRIQDGRRDCCRFNSVPDDERKQAKVELHQTVTENTVDRIMELYAKQLLRPFFKVIVILSFMGLVGCCMYSVSKLEQKFDFTDVLPKDSYVTDFYEASEEYLTRSSLEVGVYFRDVNQSDPEIQDQMENYVNDLPTIPAISKGPINFWLRDFRYFTANDTATPFHIQLQHFLANPLYGHLYGKDIVMDENGDIIVSRCWITMDNVDVTDVNNQIDALEDQRSVTVSQPINQDRDNYAFFAFENLFNVWEFYRDAIADIIFTTFIGVVSVTIIAILLVPHWSAAFFVLPLLSTLYIELLGFMQWFGVNIDVVAYVALVMSIGLLVDFLMHPLIRYYEAPGGRKEKTVDMLSTMGSSILIGAISTFLGTVPLAFCSSTIFRTIFVAFLGMVLLGCSHGLILLPVLLSMFGPEYQVNRFDELGNNSTSTEGSTANHSSRGKSSTVGEENNATLSDDENTSFNSGETSRVNRAGDGKSSADCEEMSNLNLTFDENSSLTSEEKSGVSPVEVDNTSAGVKEGGSDLVCANSGEETCARHVDDGGAIEDDGDYI